MREARPGRAGPSAGRREGWSLTAPHLLGGMQTVVEPLLFSGIEGGGSSQGLTLELYLYGEAFTRASFGYAAAIAVAVILIAAVLSMINYFLVSRTARTA